MQDGNFYRSFEARVRQNPTAILFELETEEILTRQWLDTRSARFANTLCSLGCITGDRVAVQLDKSPDAFALYLACVRAGFCYMPVNTAYKSAELSFLLQDAQPRVFLRTTAAEALADGALPVETTLCTFDADGGGTFADISKSAAEKFSTVELPEVHAAAVLYTSGTTGRPKGAVLSHRALSYTAQTLSEVWKFSEADVLLHTLPIFHSHGLFISFNVALVSGARLLLRTKFEAVDAVQALGRSTVFMGVPTFYHRLASLPSLTKDACRNMRLFVCGSAPLSADLHREFEARTGQRILERYGSTEAMIICSNPIEGERRPGSVGFPIPGVEMRIAGKEDEALPPGEVGMIQARGPGFFTSYLNRPDLTQQEYTPTTSANAWLHSSFPWMKVIRPPPPMSSGASRIASPTIRFRSKSLSWTHFRGMPWVKY
jgi:malonyl-CoA/methylmalonyl-CoA synthetase